MFKSPVLRSDWLARITGALMFCHSTSGRKVSRAGRGRSAKPRPLSQSERTRSGLSRCDWMKCLSNCGAGGVAGAACRSVVISVWLRCCHSSEGRLFAAPALWDYSPSKLAKTPHFEPPPPRLYRFSSAKLRSAPGDNDPCVFFFCTPELWRRTIR